MADLRVGGGPLPLEPGQVGLHCVRNLCMGAAMCFHGLAASSGARRMKGFYLLPQVEPVMPLLQDAGWLQACEQGMAGWLVAGQHLSDNCIPRS